MLHAEPTGYVESIDSGAGRCDEDHDLSSRCDKN
jgi:hypothetical protein